MLSQLRLQNFRSYQDKTFTFGPNINLIIGPNASGKTNLLEAIFFICQGRSYRAVDSEIIKFNNEALRLAGINERDEKKEIKIYKNKKILIEKEKEIKNTKDYFFNPVVLFEPDQLTLLADRPEKRRDYLDDLIETTKDDYRIIRKKYNRTLNQRNALLKNKKINKNQIFPWDFKLSELSSLIINERINLTETINKYLKDIYKNISGKETDIEIKYLTSWPKENYASNFLNELEKTIQDDILRGYTSIGPHREDFLINLNQKKTKSIASRGEIRTIILALKLIEAEIVKINYRQKPIILLDDVFGELDQERQTNLINSLTSYQIFITLASFDNLFKNSKHKHTTIFTVPD
jgi:DNA replication and repair protein RecF